MQDFPEEFNMSEWNPKGTKGHKQSEEEAKTEENEEKDKETKK